MNHSILRFFIITIFLGAFSQGAQSSENSRQEYLKLIEQYPRLIKPQGDHTGGEIEIVIDPVKMAAIEKKTGREVGLVQRDKYWVWLNDACIFPNGAEGVYGRILWVSSLESCPGVIVMPILPNGKIVLNCNFRHATRSWEIELPRGALNAGEDVEAAARRETLEETGMIVDHLYLLGEIPPDTGLTNTVAPLFAAKVVAKEDARPEDSEAIESIISLSISEIKEAFLKGYYEYPVRGVNKQIPFRDPFLSYAVLLYELKQMETP